MRACDHSDRCQVLLAAVIMVLSQVLEQAFFRRSLAAICPDVDYRTSVYDNQHPVFLMPAGGCFITGIDPFLDPYQCPSTIYCKAPFPILQGIFEGHPLELGLSMAWKLQKIFQVKYDVIY